MSIRLQVGEARVSTIVEQQLDGINHLIALATPDAVREIEWLGPPDADGDGQLLGVIQATVVEIGGKVVVIDTCVGNDKHLPIDPAWDGLDTDFLDRLRDAGFNERDVDVVVCTHLHLDHVGWNTRWVDGEWVPTFPNARHVFCRTEYEHWAEVAETPLPDPVDDLDRRRQLFPRTQQHVHRESVEPIVGAGLADIIDVPHEPVTGVRLVPTPGHTPGHVSVVVESGGAELFITGDAFHHPCQIARPDWSTRVDHDRDLSSSSRRHVLQRLVDSSALMLGSHFSPPGVGRIVQDGESYRFEDHDATSRETSGDST